MADSQRYKCTACGNLTRFDVTISRRTKAFHHFTVGGDLSVEEEVVLDESVESVVCRWCDHGKNVVPIDADEIVGESGAAPSTPASASTVVAGAEAADANG